MKNNNSVVVFNITDGSGKDRIFDAFKYYKGGKIDLWFRLQEADTQPSGGFCFSIETLGTENAVANEYFSIDSIEYVKESDWEKRGNIIHLTGDCDLFYLDADGHNGFDVERYPMSLGVAETGFNTDHHYGAGAYHVDFDMTYDTETHKGTMTCYNFQDCYYDPYDY